MSQALYRKWRPQRWDQVVGQEHVVQTLRNEVTAGRVAHAYLFAGPRGTGKTTTARLLAKAVNCLEQDLSKRPCHECDHCLAADQGRFLDLIEIDAASNTSVEDVRSLRDKINFSPNQGPYKVYIIDEVHMLSAAAFNALLKTLEEPPSHAIFILATTEVHKIPATVLSRCQRHEFRRIPVNDIVAELKRLAQGESIQVSEEALHLVARQSTGSLRDAVSLLDQLASTGSEVTLEMAQSVLGTAASQAVLDVVNALLAEDAKAGLEQIHLALDAGSDPRQFARQIVDYLRGLLLIRMGNAGQVEATAETRAQMARHAQAFTSTGLLLVIRAFNYAATDARLAWQPSLPLEMAFVEALEKPQEQPTQDIPIAQAVSASPGAAKPTGRKSQPKNPRAPDTEQNETETTSLPNGLTVDKIMQNWSKVLAVLHKDSNNIEALLRSGKIMGIKDGILYYGLSEVLKLKLEKKENIDLIQQALKEVFGAEVPFRVMAATGKQNSPPPGVDSDGMVATALRDLGGEIVDVQ
ncbi:MAG: DNA polymerase III subunit gamma/tau [Omnitrophica WOR_2 bacterium]